MTKRTPGPWLVYEPINPQATFGIDAESGSDSPCIWGETRYDGGFPLRADAVLAAAAPELLEVLQSFVDHEVEYMTINSLGDPEKQHNVKWARAVIAKATGATLSNGE